MKYYDTARGVNTRVVGHIVCAGGGAEWPGDAANAGRTTASQMVMVRLHDVHESVDATTFESMCKSLILANVVSVAVLVATEWSNR